MFINRRAMMYIYTAWKPTHHLKQATSTYSKLSGNWKKSYKGAPIYGLPPYPDSSAGKESTCNAGELGLIPGLGRYPGEGKGYTIQYSGLENSMECRVHGVTKSRTRLSNFHFTVLYFIVFPHTSLMNLLLDLVLCTLCIFCCYCKRYNFINCIF